MPNSHLKKETIHITISFLRVETQAQALKDVPVVRFRKQKGQARAVLPCCSCTAEGA